MRRPPEEPLHLPMPTDRRLVKWGGLVLRGDRSGKEDMDKEKNEREKGYRFWSRIQTYITT